MLVGACVLGLVFTRLPIANGRWRVLRTRVVMPLVYDLGHIPISSVLVAFVSCTRGVEEISILVDIFKT